MAKRFSHLGSVYGGNAILRLVEPTIGNVIFTRVGGALVEEDAIHDERFFLIAKVPAQKKRAPSFGAEFYDGLSLELEAECGVARIRVK